MKNFFDAFISYGRADSKDFATKLNKRLTAQGLNTWFDQEDIPLAVDYQEQINDGIERAHNFIFIIAPHSVNSEYCFKEINLAIQHNKRVIPLLHLEQINQETWQERNPNKTEDDWKEYQSKGLHSSFSNMHPTISKINWVYFRDNIDNFDSSLAGLFETIDRHKNYVEQHTNLLVKALDWWRNQRQMNYLLIGEDRREAEKWLTHRFAEGKAPCTPTDLHCEFISESTKNANNLMTQVFLASSEKDKKIRDNIGKMLMREGLTVWKSKTDIKTGNAFQKEINKGIEGADNFVYLISPDSLESKYCQQELAHAFVNNKRIILSLIKNANYELITSQLKKLQFIDFTEHEDEEKYSLAINKLLGELKKDSSYHEKHKILLVKALKWESQKHNPSLLLQGYNLQHFEAWLKVARRREDYSPLPLQQEFILASLNKPEESSLEVFISYSRADSDLARKLNDALQELGKTTWFDQESIATGADFRQEIYRGIESSDNFLFIISPKSVNSPYCTDEVEYAQKLNKRFVTILHRQLPREDRQKLPPALASVQWLDFNQHGGEFFANFNELVRTLDTDRDHVRSHTKWSQRALEWREKGSEDLLLRGSELAIAQNWLEEAEKNNKQPPAADLQKSFIGASADLDDRLKQAEAVRRQREIRTSWGIAVGSLIAVVVSSGLGLMAWQKTKQAELNMADALSFSSLSIFEQGKELDAFVQAIEAGKILQNQQAKNPQVINALQEVLNERSEHNRLEGHDNSVFSVSFSPDGKTLATGSYDNRIKLWNLETGREIRTLQGHDDSVFSVSFSPIPPFPLTKGGVGGILASGSADKTIKLWNLETGEEIRTLRGHDGSVSSLSFSPDGKTLASGSADKTIKLWNLETGKEIRTLQGHDNEVRSVSFSPDGKTLASGSADKTIKLWNLETGKEIHTLRGHDDAVKSVSFKPDGKTLASGSIDKTIKLWNLETGKEIRTLQGHDNDVNSVSFSPDGKTLASGGDDNRIKLWNPETGTEIRTLQGHDNDVNSVSFSPDGKTLATGSQDKTIKLWILGTGKEIRTLQGHDNEVKSVSFSPLPPSPLTRGGVGGILASGSGDYTIKLWNLETGTEIRTLQGHRNSVNSVGFSPDGKTLASGSSDKTIKLWNLETGKEIRTLRGHDDYVRSVSFSPDGKTLASGSYDKTIKLWNLETGKEIRTLRGHDDYVRSVSFSPDGKTLASGSSDKTIKLWSLETGKEIRTLGGHNGYVWSVSFNPNGKTLASGSGDYTIKLWSLETGKEIRTLRGHNNSVRSVSFSPDGKTLASGSDDKTIKLWNLETGEEIRTLGGYDNSVRSVSFSPDGKTLASGSDDKTIKLWNLGTAWDLDSLMGRSCDWVRNYLQNNINVSKSDRHLCDGIGRQSEHSALSY